MKNSILPFILGMIFGLVFHNDIPIVKDINYQSIRDHLMGIAQEVQGSEE